VFISCHVAYESFGQLEVLAQLSGPIYYLRLECSYLVMWPLRTLVNLTCWPSIPVLFIISAWSIPILTCDVTYESCCQLDVLGQNSSPICYHRLECSYLVTWPMRAVVN